MIFIPFQPSNCSGVITYNARAFLIKLWMNLNLYYFGENPLFLEAYIYSSEVKPFGAKR